MKAGALPGGICAAFLFVLPAVGAVDNAAPAPAYYDVARADVDDVTLLVSGSDAKVSFRARGARYLVDSVFHSQPGGGLSSAMQFIELIRESNYISLKREDMQRQDLGGLPVFEVTAIAVHLPAETGASTADTSQDALLDARLDLAMLLTNHTGTSPRVMEAKARLDALSRNGTAPLPPEYAAHVKQRLKEAEAEDAVLAVRYTEQHPKRIPVLEKIHFLQGELQQANQMSER
jgi:hypothetical protein